MMTADGDAMLVLRQRLEEQIRVVNGGDVASLTPGEELLPPHSIARVLLHLDRRISHMARLAAELRGCPEGDGILAAQKCDAAVRLLKDEFWQGASLLGLKDVTAGDVRALAEKLTADARADEAA